MYQYTRMVAVLLGLSVLMASGGCGDTKVGTTTNTVTGKVTLNGDAVDGTIHFVTADGKEFRSVITPLGTYEVQDIGPGEVTILIKPVPGTENLKTAKIAAAEKVTSMLPGSKSVQPPKKYADPQTSGLKYTVTSGPKQRILS